MTEVKGTGIIKVTVFPAKANPKATLREKMDDKYGRNKS